MAEFQTPPPVPPAAPTGTWIVQPAPRKASWLVRMGKGLLAMLFILSIIINIELLVLLFGTGEGLSTQTLRQGKADQVVALYEVEGMIDDVAAENFRRFYRAVGQDKNIKAVVLRVNSPGGGVAASDEIYHMVSLIAQKSETPVIVSMGGVAASGGYYISAPGDTIFAEPGTVTGSIGVIAVWPVVKDLLSRNGIEVVTIRSQAAQRWKAKENFWETPEPRARQEVQDMLDVMQEKFERAVRDGRVDKLKVKTIQVAGQGGAAPLVEVEPFNGRVYVAERAVELGLVDEIGYLDDAIEAAIGKADLGEPKVVRYSRHESVLEAFGAAVPAAPINAKLLDELMTPRVMMMWKVQ